MNATPIVTFTLNASVDTTYRLGRLRPGGINRVEHKEAVAGGKGNNVARVLVSLGRSVIASGFVGGANGGFIEASLRAAGITTAFHRASGDSRTCLTIVERESSTVTEIREPGEPIDPGTGAELLTAVPRIVGQARTAVVSASLPPGLAPDYYVRLIGALKDAGLWVVLDASGAAGALALDAGPDVIKPNWDELVELSGPIADESAAVIAAKGLLDRLGAEATVLLTLGARGAILVRGDRVLRARAPAIAAVNPVGAGDAFLAGYVAGAGTGTDPAQLLRAAVATGTAAALQSGIGVVDPADVVRIRKWVAVEDAA